MLSSCSAIGVYTPHHHIRVQTVGVELELTELELTELEDIDYMIDTVAKHYAIARGIGQDVVQEALKMNPPVLVLSWDDVYCRNTDGSTRGPMGGCFSSTISKNYTPTATVLWRTPCRAETAVMHEFIHFFDWMIFEPDPDHSVPGVWRDKNGALLKAEWEAVNILCQDKMKSIADSLEEWDGQS